MELLHLVRERNSEGGGGEVGSKSLFLANPPPIEEINCAQECDIII